MTNTIYIHQPEKAVSFTRLPNFLFEAPTFTPLSNEAKVLYAFILRRTDLSRKNGWADEYGRIYLYYPINEVVELLHCGRQKAVNTLREPGRRVKESAEFDLYDEDWGKSLKTEMENDLYEQKIPMYVLTNMVCRSI